MQPLPLSDHQTPEHRTTQEAQVNPMPPHYGDDTRTLITEALNNTIGPTCGVMLDTQDTDTLLAWLTDHNLTLTNTTTPEPTEQPFEPPHTTNITITIDGNHTHAETHLKQLLTTIHNTH